MFEKHLFIYLTLCEQRPFTCLSWLFSVNGDIITLQTSGVTSFNPYCKSVFTLKQMNMLVNKHYSYWICG